MSKYTLLIIETDEDLRSTLVEQLAMYEEFEIIQEENPKLGIEIPRERNVDLIIFDIDSPNLNGRESIKELRVKGFHAPIIVIIRRDMDCDTILNCDVGANDYVSKPFRFSVLLARIRTQLHQYKQNEWTGFRIGSYLFKPRQKLLIDQHNNKTRLTEKETEILTFLYCTKDQIISRETLLKKIWGYNENVVTHTLETHIYRLRQKIEKNPSHAQILIADNNGYRLNL